MEIIKVGLVIMDEHGRILVARKHGGTTYILIGGKPEGDESDLTCLHREVMEEIGVHVVGAPVLLGTFEAPAADMPGHTAKVRAWRGAIVGEPVAQAEIAEIRWIDPADPDVPIADTIRLGVIPALLEPEGAPTP